MVILRFDPKTVICGLQRAEEEGAFTPIIASSRTIAAMAVMAASLLAVSCEELLSLTSQQDFMR